jgi:hypothetical protein
MGECFPLQGLRFSPQHLKRDSDHEIGKYLAFKKKYLKLHAIEV